MFSSSNMLTVLSVDDFGGAAALFSTWNSLGTILVQEKNDIQLLDAASSCMRSVTNKICTDKEGEFNLRLHALIDLLLLRSYNIYSCTLIK